MHGGEVTGVVSIQVTNTYAFGENDLRLLTTLANAMSVALQNAKSFEAEQERVAELAIINSVQAALAAELNIQGIYEAVSDQIRDIFQDTDMSIRIYDPKTNRMIYPYSYEQGKRITIEPHQVQIGS